jgi:hypothetical protein
VIPQPVMDVVHEDRAGDRLVFFEFDVLVMPRGQ